MAAPAYTKMKASWQNPIRRGFQHFDQFSADVPGFFFQIHEWKRFRRAGQREQKRRAHRGVVRGHRRRRSSFSSLTVSRSEVDGSRGLKCNRQVAKNAAINYATHPPLLKILNKSRLPLLIHSNCARVGGDCLAAGSAARNDTIIIPGLLNYEQGDKLVLENCQQYSERQRTIQPGCRYVSDHA